MNHQPDLIVHNGRIYTVDPTLPWAEAVAVRGPWITAVGSNAEILALSGPETQVIDLHGRLVLPGLCDAHIHLYDWSLARQQVLLAGCADKAEMMARIKARAEQSDTGWLLGRGWNEIGWPDRAMPTRDDLDAVTGPDQPAIFWRSDMHAAVANSAALAIAGITADTFDPTGGVIGREENGRPDGLLWELAINQVMAHIPLPSPAEIDEALSDGMAELRRVGVTAVHDQRMKDQSEGPRALASYQRLRQSGKLRLRINCNIAAHDLPHLAALGLRSGLGDDYLRLGHVKLFTDGTMGSRTAWMLAPFVPQQPGAEDNYGVILTPPAQMAAEFRQAIELGFPISVHAIGDRANRVCLDIFEELLPQVPLTAVPHRIEHVQIIDPADIPRLARLGITASVQPVHATEDMDIAELVLGERANRVYNFQSLAASGALLALGSDAPVVDVNPFLGFHAAVRRQRVERMPTPPWYGDEQLTLEQTIYGFTLGAARAGGWDQTIGSITPGKRADLIALDRNLFDLVAAGITGDELAATRVEVLIFDGVVA
jgi:predicted amidohydrolase YtcJ